MPRLSRVHSSYRFAPGEQEFYQSQRRTGGRVSEFEEMRPNFFWVWAPVDFGKHTTKRLMEMREGKSVTAHVANINWSPEHDRFVVQLPQEGGLRFVVWTPEMLEDIQDKLRELNSGRDSES